MPLTDMRAALANRTRPVFFITRSPDWLVGIERWAPFVRIVSMKDAWDDRDGGHPLVFTPSKTPWLEPRDEIGAANWLLRNRDVQHYLAAQSGGEAPQLFFPFFNAETERLCAELGYEVLLPPHSLRHRLDSKLTTTRLGNEIGIRSVPNTLATVRDYDDLLAQAEAAGLGDDLVVQLAYGETGLTTFFIASRADFDAVAHRVIGPELKVMRRIRPLSFAIEAVATRDGTVVGRLLRELVGLPELTLTRGGWSGSELYGPLLDDEARATAADYTRRFGDRMYDEGFRGVFGLDFLVDADTGEVYLGELNPRYTGSAIISNVPMDPEHELPLLAIHLLEYTEGAPLDAAAANAVTQPIPAETAWSSFLVRHTGAPLVRVAEGPRSGRYRLDARGQLEFLGDDLDWVDLGRDGHTDEFMIVRSRAIGDYVHRGFTLALGVTRQPLQAEPDQLTAFGAAVIAATRKSFRLRPMPQVLRYFRAGLRVAQDKLRRK